MTDEKEDKRDFFSKMDTVQKVFFVIAICIVSLIRYKKLDISL